MKQLPEKLKGLIRDNAEIDAINKIIDYLQEREEITEFTHIHERMHSMEKLEEESKEWPQMGDPFYRLNSQGMIIIANWTDSLKQNAIRSLMGIFRTEAEAKTYRERLLSPTQEK